MPIEFQTSSVSREIDCRVKEASGLQVPIKYPNLISTDYKIFEWWGWEQLSLVVNEWLNIKTSDHAFRLINIRCKKRMTRSQEKYSACVAYLISISFGTKVVLNHGPCLSGSAFFSSCLLFPFTANIKLMVASSTHIVQSSIASLQACVLNIIHSGERIKFQRTISNL